MKEDKDTRLNEIHKIAASDSHLMVPFSRNQLVMAKKVIKQMEDKLMQISELAKVA